MTDFGERRRRLPKTGQVISYRDYDDGYYQKGWRDGERFKDVGDGTVVDNATGLMWPKNATGEGGAYGGPYTWNWAIDWFNYVTLGGYTDWRLPNIFEYQSLVDYSLDPIRYSDIIQNAGAKDYWTSTTDPHNSNNGLLITYRNLSYRAMPKTFSFYLLLCRDA